MKAKVLLGFLFLFILGFYIGCSKDDNPTIPNESTEIGQLIINPSSILANLPTQVTVRLNVNAGVTLIDSTAKLVKVDASNTVIQELGLLLDNGELSNGDEILGDNVFSALVTLTQSAGEIKLRVIANVMQNNVTKPVNSNVLSFTVYPDFTSQELKQVLNTQDSAASKFTTYLGGNVNNIEPAIAQLKTWLQTQPGVNAVETEGTSSMEIKYSSGVYGNLIFAQEDVNGTTIITRGGAEFLDDRRKSSRTIPIKSQTRGTIDENKIPSRIQKLSDLDPKIIGNRNVMIYAPFEAAFSPWNEGQKVVDILNSSDFKFQITYLKNLEATISSLYNLTDYGYVVLATHGSGGKVFLSGEQVDTTLAIYTNSYKAMLKAGKISISKNLVVKKNGAVSIKADVYGIRFPFISDLAGKFPNSVILNNSCESTKSVELENAFTGKGAKTYYGYSKIVSSRFCIENADTLTRRLAKELKTTGNSFLAGSDPYSTHNAAFQMKGANDVYYPDDLINGDFEFGKIDGWTKDGDGRVISKLGTVNPSQPNFMGIISTGLGYTVATGSIFQTFTVRENQTTIKVKWNFLSEEFLEYINSAYQDYFKITIRKADGSEDILYSKTIDEIAADFGAQKFNGGEGEVPQPGNLVYVSPGIVFDQGDVYMTDWQTITFDVSAYKGTRITLILAAGDVGDSIYDTAIILDEISIY
jgi:hypothetical protein